jgi:hypothetical protein
MCNTGCSAVQCSTVQYSWCPGKHDMVSAVLYHVV